MFEGLDLYGERDRDLRRSEDRKTYDPKRLWQSHHEIINLALVGMRQIDIAERLGVTQATVSNVLNSTIGREKLMQGRIVRDAKTFDAAKEISELAQKSLETYKTILDSEGEQAAPLGLKFQASKTILNDLSGLAAPKRVDSRTLNAYLTSDDLERIKERGRKAAEELGIVIEVKSD